MWIKTDVLKINNKFGKNSTGKNLTVNYRVFDKFLLISYTMELNHI